MQFGLIRRKHELMKAVDKLDIQKDLSFLPTQRWIRQAITRAIADQARTIRIPVHMVETINKLVREQREFPSRIGSRSNSWE